MIRRPRHLVNAPDVLADVGSPAAAERQAAHEYYNALPLPTASMTFSAYGNDEVKHRLNELSITSAHTVKQTSAQGCLSM